MFRYRTLKKHIVVRLGGWVVAMAALTAMSLSLGRVVAQEDSVPPAPAAGAARPAPPVETTSEPVGTDAPTISVAGTIEDEQGRRSRWQRSCCAPRLAGICT